MTKFGSFLRAERERIGLNQEGLAKLIGCKQPYIAHLESGRRRPESFILWQQFQDIFKWSDSKTKEAQELFLKGRVSE